MSKAVRFIFALFVLAFGMAHAANFSKNGYSYLQISGSTAKYSLSPTNYGSLQFPNTGWQLVGGALASGLTIGKTQNLPVPVGAQLPAVIKAVVPQKSIAKALVNPWGIVASMALQETLGVLAETACVRLAGGVMVNNNGLWEECYTQLTIPKPEFKYYLNVTPQSLHSSASSACTASSRPDGGGLVNYKYAFIREPNECRWYGETYPPSTYDPTWSPQIFNTYAGTVQSGWFCGTVRVDWPDSICNPYEEKKWKPTSSVNAESKIQAELEKTPTIATSIFNDLYDQGVEFQDVSNPVIEGPSSVKAGDPITVVKTNPDGTSETVTQQYYRNYSYSGDSVTHVSTTVNNVTNTTNNNTTNTTTITTTTPTNNPDQKELETCGLPGKPACKIDETGTPDADNLDQSQVEQAFSAIKTCLQNPIACLPSLPDLNWTFALPSGCSPIPVTGFAPFIDSIDICQFQPVFHDLMSMVWAAVGLFMAAGMMFREANGG